MRLVLFSILLTGWAGLLPQVSGGAVSGRILSAKGTPEVGVRVAAVFVAGAKSDLSTQVLASIVETDLQGVYRLENLEPGQYFIRAGLVDSPTFFPGTVELSKARVIDVGRGSTVAGVDFSLVGSPGVSIRGRVTWDPRQPVLSPGSRVLLARGAQDFAEVRPSEDGAFEFSRVPPGQYSVALRGAVSIRGIVVSDSDISGIELAVPLRSELTARLVVEGESPLPAGAMSLLLSGDSRQGTVLQFGADGTARV